MKYPIRNFLGGLILVAAVVLSALRTLPARPLPASAPESEFSAERAMVTVKSIATAPRLVGSPAYENAKAYLLTQLETLGLETEVQKTTLDGVAVENVIGRLEGAGSLDAILLSAHLDSVADSPGATDDGSGVAAVLEAVRALKAGTPLRNTIIVLFTGPEETCCYGARAFVEQHPWAKSVHMVVNLDAGGLNGPSILAATGPYEGWLVEQAAPILPDPIGSSAIEALGSPATDYTLLFRKAGWTGFDFNLSWSKRIHSPLDNVENLDPASLQAQGEHMLAIARHFGKISLEFPPTATPIYFDILGLKMVYYPASWAINILVWVTLIFGVVMIVGFQRKYLSAPGIGLGALVFLLSLITVPLLLGAIQLFFFHLDPPPGNVLQGTPPVGTQVVAIPISTSQLISDLTGDSLLSNIIRWGSAALSILATYLWVALARRAKKVNKVDLVMGVDLVLYLAALGTSLAFPALSYLFIWPLLAGLIATFFWFSSSRMDVEQPGWLEFLGLLVAAVIAVIMFVPGILIALMSIDIQMIYLVPVFVVALLGYLFPTLAVIQLKNRQEEEI